MSSRVRFRALIALAALICVAAIIDRIPLRAQAQPAQTGAARDVIVILRDQLDGNPPVRRAMQGRSAALAAAQNAVFARMPANTSRKKTQFRMINAFATSATQAEEQQLAQDPDVLAVVPDQVVRVVTPAAQAAMPALANSVTPASAAAQLCNTLEPEALQLTHTAYLDPSIPQAQQVRDGNGELVTGRGVKVAFLADSLDPNLPGFTHTDGTPVFIDYQDFSGNAPNEPSDSREAFLDASSIAAQDTPGGTPLTFDISAYRNAPPVPSPCNIRIRGMAPGASLVGLNVQSSYLNALSSFVRAIEYAVVVDDVDVISESFVTNIYPDQTIDPISLANKAAVQAGVTVVALTGDAGAGGTIGSPGSDPEVIEVGATTQLRSYAQTGISAMPLATGYVSNNIAPFSSSGFTQKTGRTIDVVAPGDLGWALCSTNTALFTGCRTLSAPGMPSPIQLNGGTSESAPFVAGEVALVIQAYRSTHGGRSPDPSLVKRIIMSTATDLGAPPEQQGAGLINALAAVYAALAAKGEHGPAAHPTEANNSLLVTAEPGSFALTDDPGEAQSLRITLTNLGSKPQSLSPTLQSLNQKIASDSGLISIDTTIQNFTQQPFVVPANADNLSVSISYPITIGSASNPLVSLALIDASGRLVGKSSPQSTNAGFMHVEAVRPAAGTWTAVAYGPPAGAVGSYAGPIQFSWRADRMTSIGTVSPAHLTLAPGASARLTAAFSMPESPGDSAAVLRLNAIGSAAESDPAVPISLRTLVPVSPQGATFSGTLTGGNSRFGIGPTQFYSFDVPRGVKDMSLILNVLGDGHVVQGILVDPHGLPYSFNSNEDPFFTGAPTTSMQLNRYEPTPGRWQFSLTDYFTTSGQQTETSFSASLAFNAVRVTADGLPNSDRIALSAGGAPLEVPIVVTNNSRTTQMYFADARLSTSVTMQLPVFPGCGNPPMLPVACFFSYVPPQSKSVSFRAQSTVPVSMTAWDYAGTLTPGTNTFSSMILGRPDKTGTTTATLSASEIPYSTWFIQPAPIGPSGASGPPTDPVSLSATAIARDFDTAMIADSGNAWMDIVALTATYNPLILAPGETGVIHLFIQPDPAMIGKTVSGDVFIDTFNFVQFNGDELARIPYRYRVVH